MNGKSVGAYPFTLGVASGDPMPGSIVLWTRLAPEPYETGGGLPQARIGVHWQLAHDEGFRRIARSGYAMAHPEFNHAVHIEVRELDDTDRTLPDHFNREPITLDEYRVRYGLYKSDPDPIGAHAAHPFVVTWDDHEVDNN